MRKFNLFSPARASAKLPAAPVSGPPAILVRPLRPAVAALTYERRSFARLAAPDPELSGSAELAAREPLAYPSSPTRLAGAARPSFQQVNPDDEMLNPRRSAYESRFLPSPMQRPYMRRPGELKAVRNRPEKG